MKHTLTSKERRGLWAVAAAALLCISSAFILRNCTSLSRIGQRGDRSDHIIQFSDSIADSDINVAHDSQSDLAMEAKKAKSAKKTKKSKAQKSYPIRDPLSEPCD